MKVVEGQSSILDLARKNQRKKGPEEDGGFQKIMEQEKARMEGKGVQGVQVPFQPSGGVEILRPSADLGPISGAGRKEELMEELNQTLDLVDFYASRLSDTSLSVQDMNPLITHLEERLEHLGTLENNGALPERLKEVI
ncbi:MAG: hypothetical protein JW821_18855, partial [Deltaproteobacteria bacterium]|nr:hypothetical protein [Deltaproteobacteria bacterium]